MGYALRAAQRRRSRPKRIRRARANGRRMFWLSAVQSVSITGSGGIVIGGTGNTSTSVYGPGAAGRVAPAVGRGIG